MAADRISASELQDLMAAGQPINIVDVRSPADVDWAIPGSTHVDAYLALKSGRIGSLAEVNFPPGRVVTVCGVGQTAAIATRMLRARGVEASTLEGGMRAWSLAWNTAEAAIGGCDILQVRRTGKGCLSYVVASQGEAIVIDASVDPDVYGRLLAERGWRLAAVVDTHIHADHLSRSRTLAEQNGVDSWMPTQDRTRYRFRPIREGDLIPFGSAVVNALATPGHTAESTTYLIDDVAAFTGDTLFLRGVGRPDLEGGPGELASRARLLHDSVARSLELPDATLILPGHVSEPIAFDGRLLATKIGTIRETVALASMDQEAFVEAVLARIPAAAPPNHSVIVELNERGEMPKDPCELEAGANRCAVA